jgi:acyl carrier protein
MWSVAELETLVIELLADSMAEDQSELRERLLAHGSNMPVDSLDLFEILVEFRSRTGITLPKRELRRDIMRSVRRFSEFAANGGQE